ncbi:MAG: sigma factor, partial [Planctomycetota bacterium]
IFESGWAMRIVDAGSTNPELIKLLADMGQTEAWSVFVRRYTPMTRSICSGWGLCQDDIEDVQAQVSLRLVQTFLKAENRVQSSFRGYLKRIIAHEIHDFMESKNRQGLVGLLEPQFLDELACKNKTIDADLEWLETSILQQLEAMQRVLSVVECKVGKPTWKTFWMITIQGTPCILAAEMLKIPYLTAYQRNLRVMRLMRQEAGLPDV